MQRGLDYLKTNYTKERFVVGLVLLILALFAPLVFFKAGGAPSGHQTQPITTGFISLFWRFYHFNISDSLTFQLLPEVGQNYVFHIPFRILFVLEGARYATGQTSKIRLLISGMMGDLIVALPLSLWGYYGTVPTPFLLLIGVPLVHHFRGQNLFPKITVSDQPITESQEKGKLPNQNDWPLS